MSSGVQPVFNLNEKTGGGFGGSEWLWVVVLFVLLGGGGNLFGNKGNAATQADIQRGFDYSNEMSQMRGLTYGQANSTYALTNDINGLEKTVMQGNFGIMQQLAQNQQSAQMCCCETNRNIDAVRTEGYRNTCSIVEAIKEDGEKTRAMFSAYQMAELKAKLEERDRQLMTANILNGQTSQTADLIQRLRPAPIPAFIVPNPSAPTGTTPTT